MGVVFLVPHFALRVCIVASHSCWHPQRVGVTKRIRIVQNVFPKMADVWAVHRSTISCSHRHTVYFLQSVDCGRSDPIVPQFQFSQKNVRSYLEPNLRHLITSSCICDCYGPNDFLKRLRHIHFVMSDVFRELFSRVLFSKTNVRNVDLKCLACLCVCAS